MHLHAAIVTGNSLEWLADTSHGIGIYSVTSLHEAEEEDPALGAARLSLNVETTLKGGIPKATEVKQMIVVNNWSRDPRQPKDAFPPIKAAVKDRFLVFFRLAENGAPKVVWAINISRPPPEGYLGAAITAAFQVLTDGEKIVEVVRERLRAHPRTEPVSSPSQSAVQVPSQSPAFRTLYSGSICYLHVPEDLRPTRRPQ